MTDEPLLPVPSAPAPLSLVSLPLQQTQPWVRFLAIMGFVAAGFMVLVGVTAGVAGAVTGRLETLGLMVVYPIVAVFYVFPSMFLLRYADRIRTFVASGLEQDLASALDAQRSFWKFAGIFTIVSVVFGILATVLAMIAGIMVGMSGRTIGV
ncbi:MAG TPA: DUF5362 family protein [Vicinamibacterales bacterium]|jgi:hypothetical protein